MPFIVLGASWGGGWLMLRHHPHRHLYLFCAAWALIALTPYLALIGSWIDWTDEDPYFYLPSFGVCLIAADVAASYIRAQHRHRNTVLACGAAVLLMYAVTLFHVQSYFLNDIALFSRYAERLPHDSYSHLRLGMMLEQQGDLARARGELKMFAARNPRSSIVVLNELARVDERLGDHAAAARAMSEWIARLKAPTPDDYAQLAIADDAAGDTAGADSALAKTAALSGGIAAAAVARARIRLRHDDRTGAENVLRELLRQQPGNRDALLDLAMMLTSEHRNDEAIAIYRRAAAGLSHAPDIHYRIALLLHQMGRDPEAREECASALKQAPNDPKARALMAELDRGLTR
ncbi:MAG: tetratricopeptide repeat protein [Candidatus Binataceae bacterium]